MSGARRTRAARPAAIHEPVAVRGGAVALLLALALLLAYSNSFRVPFVFDDVASIPGNPSIRSLAASFTPPPQLTVSGRPAVNVSFAIDYALGGLSLAGFHAVNLLIHWLAALLLYGLVRRTLLLSSLRERWGQAAGGVAFATAALWALHPLQTESVTYVVQRCESLMGLAYLGTLYAFVRGATAATPRGAQVAYALAIAASLLGMASKEVMVTAPLAVLLYDRAFLAGSWRELLQRRGGVHAALWATLGLLVALTAGGPRSASAGFSYAKVHPLDYARGEFGVILHYLRLVVLPWPLVLDYGWPPVHTWGPALVPMLVVLALVAASVVLLVRRPAVGWPAFAFFLVLAPTSTFVPVADLAFEHRMYVPLAALLALACAGAAVLLERAIAEPRRRATIGATIAIAIALGFAGVTYARNAEYRSADVLWQTVIDRRPQNPRGYNGLAALLDYSTQRDRAIPLLERALALDSTYADAHYNLGNAWDAAGHHPEAIAEFRTAARLDTTNWKAWNNIGKVYLEDGRPDLAYAPIARALQLAPGSTEAHNNMGTLLAQAGRIADAIPQFEAAVRLDPGNASAAQNLDAARRALPPGAAPR